MHRFLYPNKDDLKMNFTEVRQSITPLITTLLGITLIWLTFWNANGIYNNIDGDCSVQFDADISGLGVRISIWAQVGVLTIISILGLFHVNETGIKEVAGGLILTHVSLAIAVVVQMSKGTLTSVDAALGAAILDAQNVALHIPHTTKETLAARWQVLILLPTQLLGLALLPVLVVGLQRGDFASEDCECLYVFWWSRLSDCGAFPGNEPSIFWTYYSLRWIMWGQSCFHSMYNAEWFHQAEKSRRIAMQKATNKESEHGSQASQGPKSLSPKQHDSQRSQEPEQSSLEQQDSQDLEKPVERATIQAGFLYNEYPATISLSYTSYALYSLTSMVAAEATIINFDLHPSSGVDSVGQIIAMVIAAATSLRASWSVLHWFVEDRFSNKLSFPGIVFRLLWSCISRSGRENDSQAPSRYVNFNPAISIMSI